MKNKKIIPKIFLASLFLSILLAVALVGFSKYVKAFTPLASPGDGGPLAAPGFFSQQDGSDVILLNPEWDGIYLQSPQKLAIGTTSADILLTVGSSTPSTVSGYRDAFFAGSVEIDGDLTVDGIITIGGITVAANLTSPLALGDATNTGTTTLETITTTNDFRISTDSTSNAFVIKDNGKVGIGTTSPLYMLDVWGTAQFTTTSGANSEQLRLTDTSIDVLFTFEIGDTGISGLATKNLVIKGSSGTSDIAFSPSTSAPGALIIKADGSIGIGTSDPTEPLTIVANGVDAIGFTNTDGGTFRHTINTQFSGSEDALNKLNFKVDDKTAGSPLTRMTITGEGNVGIGTSSPFARLGIRGKNTSSSDRALQISDSNDQSLLTVLNDGNVGIGTAAPGVLLHIAKDASDLFKLQRLNTGNNEDVGMLFGVHIASDNTRFKGGIFFQKDVAASNARGDLHFAINNTDDTSNVVVTDSKMTILRDGNVGIGTTTPRALLHINNGGGDYITIPAAVRMILQDNDTVNSSYTLGILTGTDGTGRISFADGTAWGRGKLEYKHGDDFMAFTTAGDEQMRIDSNGNLGIGTTSPAARLHVSGIIRTGVQSGTTGRLDIFSSNGVNWEFDTQGGSDLNLNTNSGATVNFSITGDNGVNVGIGTSSPLSVLTIQGTSGHLFRVATSTDYDIFQIDENGFASFTRMPMLNSNHIDNNATTTQTMAIANVPQEILFGEITDEHGNGPGSWGVIDGIPNATTTIPQDGSYSIFFRAEIKSTTGGNHDVACKLFTNSVEVEWAGDSTRLTTTNKPEKCIIEHHGEHVAGDEITVKWVADTTSAELSATSTVFSTMPVATIVIIQNDAD